MYDVLSYGRMAADGVRMDAYARAIARAVKPGSVVVDVGTGTGIFALLAARAGARRVHAVDTNAAVWVLRDVAAANGLAHVITIHHADSREIELPERADVIVADMRGSFPLHDSHLASMRDARTRWLAPGGTILPARDELFVALVEHEATWTDLERGWTSFERLGFSAAAAREATLNTIYSDAKHPIHASDVLTSAAVWGEIRYGEEFAPVVEKTVELTVGRGGTAHALALWFAATIADGIGYSNAPGSALVYNRTVLPLTEAIEVAPGDVARVTVRADARGQRWAWETEIGTRSRMRQSTFLGNPTSAATLMRESTRFAPRLSPRGERARRVLEMMDGARTVEEIARALGEPRSGGDDSQMLDEVRACVRAYSDPR